VRRWKLSEQNFKNFTIRGRFSKKNAKIAFKNFQVLRLQAVITPQWLHAHRIQYKVALWMFMVHDNRCPVYLSESVQPVSSNPVHQRLRSASSLDYIVPRTKTKFGDRAFSVAGPTVWNSLPESVRSAETLSSFKRKLKTYMFNISF